MKNVFSQGEFNKYIDRSLFESAMESVSRFSQKVTVFISHKHSDLEEIQAIIGFLEKTFNVDAYIDSRDSDMPQITSGETGIKIKERIDACNKFILLATHDAIASKWCNWELGYGDAKKFKNHIALFPIKPASISEKNYAGNEYMEIYPHIVFSDGTDNYSNGNPITKGYYVKSKNKDGGYSITALDMWFDTK